MESALRRSLRRVPLLPLAAASLSIALLDCKKADRPIGTVMMHMESHYRDIEERRDSVAGKGGGALSREGIFNAIAERSRKIAELTEEPRYVGHTPDAEFRAWRLELGRIALGLEEAAKRRDAPGVEEGYAAATRVLSACHRKFPTNARQPGR
ncbi:MAG: hypothetical protein L0323_06285 [Planctomycetes bacterium]|nr:hypothetical protein [Planctomycetota bacterium]